LKAKISIWDLPLGELKMSIQQSLTKKYIFIILTFYSGVAMSVSEPKYKVVSKSDHYEIRSYEPTIVAETLIEGDFDEAGNKAF
jgi:hypothetical protein